MRLGPGVALGQQLRRHLGHDIAVLGMDHGDPAQLRQAVEGGEELIVVHHQRALVGEEMLEGGDAAILDHDFMSLKTCSPHQVTAMWKE
jgi:hypothetical protein